ncbi:hypothetical protein [Croceibacterium aestuarii]|uniref:hypothetical protein n=1 Tax=Croceibacterium aestuarii TaxID=3064139 RepID=UPI00272ECC7F|nr:hypothetical protein [Croceibacterium sp. D39]
MNLKGVRTGIAAACAVVSLGAASSAAAQGQCSRDTLDDIAAKYVEGQKQGSIFTLPVGEWVDYRENGQLVSTATGVISQPSDFDWHLALVDTGTCHVLVHGVILKPVPYVVTTQLAWTFNGLGQIRSTVVREGDANFDAKKTYAYASKEDWSEIPAGKRDTRQALLALANAYLDRAGGGAADVALAPSCDRIDNGAYSTNCEPAPGAAFVDREFTVDEAKGAVAVVSNRGEAEGPQDSRIFRIEDGKIRHVHAVTPSQ